MNQEKFKELWENDELESVSRDVDDSWRHGSNIVEVFHDPGTTHYWEVSYQKSGDGEWHGIRENEFEIRAVKPQRKTIEVVSYVPV